MPRTGWKCCAAALAFILALPAQSAQQGSAPAAPQGDAADRDPDALAALDRMSVSMRNLNAFSIHAETTREQVLTTGQKIQFSGTLDIRVRRPNGFRIDVDSSQTQRSIYYDGRTVTIMAPRVGYYATFPAAPTIRETLTRAADRFGLEMPLSDLMTFGSDSEVAQRLTSAFRVGTEVIGGQTCEQYAMRQEGVDWQIWIREGAQALPCKIVITTTDDPSMPQYSAVFTWRPQENFAANAFTFSPPPNARQIQIAELNQAN